jgi:hypothetical protein
MGRIKVEMTQVSEMGSWVDVSAMGTDRVEKEHAVPHTHIYQNIMWSSIEINDFYLLIKKESKRK